MASCAGCGASVQADDNFCGSCGAPVDVEAHDAGPGDAAGGGQWLDDVVATRQDAAGDAGAAGHDVDALPASSAGEQVVMVEVDEEPTATSLGEPATDTQTTTILATTGGVDLVTCPGCQSVNAAQRARCARCGAALREDLDTDRDEWDLRELPEGPRAAPVVTPTSPRRRIPTWLVVVLAGVLVGAGIGVATALGLGPLAAPRGPGVTFRGQAYPDAPATLPPAQVGGSTVRDPGADGREFGGPNLLDDDPMTAWSPADADGGVITVSFADPVWITAVEVANGDQFDEEAFTTTGRVRIADIDMGRGQLVRATLLDGEGRQVLRLPTPLLTTQVTIEVDEVVGGDGVAISDIAFLGHDASPRDAASFLEGA